MTAGMAARNGAGRSDTGRCTAAGANTGAPLTLDLAATAGFSFASKRHQHCRHGGQREELSHHDVTPVFDSAYLSFIPGRGSEPRTAVLGSHRSGLHAGIKSDGRNTHRELKTGLTIPYQSCRAGYSERPHRCAGVRDCISCKRRKRRLRRELHSPEQRCRRRRLHKEQHSWEQRRKERSS